jgi:hypothetical protein
MPLSVVIAWKPAGRTPARSRGERPSACRGSEAVRAQRELVLLLARDGVDLRHLLGRLAHRLVRDGSAMAGVMGTRSRGPHAASAFTRPRASSPSTRDERLAHAARVQDRHVRQRLRPAGDDDVGVPSAI